MIVIANEYLEQSKNDFEIFKLLLNGKSVNNALFYLSQSYEKLNKYFLIIIRFKENSSNISEKEIEEEMLKYGHDKKKVVKEIISFFKINGQSNEIDKINEFLSRIILPFNVFKDAAKFCNTIQIDLDFYDKTKQSKVIQDSKLEYLRQKFCEKEIYKYRIITYILIRYFNDIENHLRYPTEKNNFSFKNSFNNVNNITCIKNFIILYTDLSNVVALLITSLNKI